jgi:hypothetical protein
MKLLENEKILIKARKHWVSLLSSFIPIILITIFYFKLKDEIKQMILDAGSEIPSYFKWIVISIFVIGGVLPILISLLNFAADKLIVTNLRVIGKQGIINTVELNSLTKDIYNVGLSSGLFGKIFNYGTVIIVTNSTYKYKYVSGGRKFTDTIIELQNKKEIV